MKQQRVKEVIMEEIPAEIKYMDFVDGRVEIVNSDSKNENNQKNLKRNKIEKNKLIIKEINEEFINQNTQNSPITNKEADYLKEIYNNDYNDTNFRNNKNEFENQRENAERLQENQYKIRVKNEKGGPMNINDRRMEEFMGDNLNNNINNNISYVKKKIQFNNQQFINNDPQIQIQQINEQEYNTFHPIKTDYNEQEEQNQIYHKEINNINQPRYKPQVKSQNPNHNNNNAHLDVVITHEDQSVHIQGKSPGRIAKKYYNKNENISRPRSNKSPDREVSPEAGVVREKKNYQLYSSNYSKPGKNAYISKNYIGSEKTTFMENKNEEIINNNLSPERNNKLNLNEIKKSEISNQKVLTSNNTKIVDAIPLEKYVQSQKTNQEITSPKIYIVADAKENSIIPQQNNIEPQIIKINKNDINNIIQSPNNNINDIIQSPNNSNSNILYPKEGFGNNQNIQKKLKKKKKKIIYRRHKPIVLQHFDVQIIQVPQNEEFLNNNYSQYPLNIERSPIQNRIYQSPNLNINRNYFQNYQQNFAPIEENKVPPVRNFYQNPNNFNNPQLAKIYPPQGEYIFNQQNLHRQYYPIINNPIFRYFNEEENIKYKIPCTPKQTLINITPMRTMNETNSPYEENRAIPYNNNAKRLYRERNRGFRPLTPPNPPKYFERRQYEFENDERYFNNDFQNDRKKNSNSLYPQRRIIERIPSYDDDEAISEDNYPHYQYNRGQRIMRSNY